MSNTIIGMLFNSKPGSEQLDRSFQTPKGPNAFTSFLERIFQGTQQLIQRIAGAKKEAPSIGQPFLHPRGKIASNDSGRVLRNWDFIGNATGEEITAQPTQVNPIGSESENRALVLEQLQDIESRLDHRDVDSSVMGELDLAMCPSAVSASEVDANSPQTIMTLSPSAGEENITALSLEKEALTVSSESQPQFTSPNSVPVSLSAQSDLFQGDYGINSLNQSSEPSNITRNIHSEAMPNKASESIIEENDDMVPGSVVLDSGSQKVTEVVFQVQAEGKPLQPQTPLYQLSGSNPIQPQEQGDGLSKGEFPQERGEGTLVKGEIPPISGIESQTGDAEQLAFNHLRPRAPIPEVGQEPNNRIFTAASKTNETMEGTDLSSPTSQTNTAEQRVFPAEAGNHMALLSKSEMRAPEKRVETPSVPQQSDRLVPKPDGNRLTDKVNQQILSLETKSASQSIDNLNKPLVEDAPGTFPSVKVRIVEQMVDSAQPDSKPTPRINDALNVNVEKQVDKATINEKTTIDEHLKSPDFRSSESVNKDAIKPRVNNNRPDTNIQNSLQNTNKSGEQAISSSQQSEQLAAKVVIPEIGIHRSVEELNPTIKLRPSPEQSTNQRLTESGSSSNSPRIDHNSNSMNGRHHHNHDSQSPASNTNTLQSVSVKNSIKATKEENATRFENTLVKESDNWSEKVSTGVSEKVNSPMPSSEPSPTTDRAFRLALVNRVTQLIEQSQHKNRQELTFRLQTENRETVEVHFSREASTNKGKILLNSESLAEMLQRQLPTILQNLQSKGIHFADLSVQLSHKGPNPNSTRQSLRAAENKGQTNGDTNESTNTAPTRRVYYYGYNTIDYVA